jgi:Ca2+-binding EF-hand superfamily protein
MQKKLTSLYKLLLIVFLLAPQANAQLYENDRQEMIKEGFDRIDLNNDRKYDFTEWWLMYENTLSKSVEKNMSDLLIASDKNKDGVLSIEEYVTDPSNKEEQENFKETDSDNNGLVSLKEIMTFSNKLNARKGEEFIKAIDKNGDSIVTWEEYYNFSNEVFLKPQ